MGPKSFNRADVIFFILPKAVLCCPTSKSIGTKRDLTLILSLFIDLKAVICQLSDHIRKGVQTLQLGFAFPSNIEILVAEKAQLECINTFSINIIYSINYGEKENKKQKIQDYQIVITVNETMDGPRTRSLFLLKRPIIFIFLTIYYRSCISDFLFH